MRRSLKSRSPQKRGVIAAMLPLLAGVILMVVSAWAFTEFFIKKDHGKAGGCELGNGGFLRKENGKPEAENKSIED